MGNVNMGYDSLAKNSFKKGMVAYYGPGDTVTSFYTMPGERIYYPFDILVLSMSLVGNCTEMLSVVEPICHTACAFR